MTCVSVEDIVSTTVQYSSFFNYEEFLKISKKSVDIFLAISKKHKTKENYCKVEEGDLLKNLNEVFYREFTYNFSKEIAINNIKYPAINKSFTYYEVYEVFEKEEILILFGSYLKEENGFFEIFLNNKKVKNIKIKFASKKNIWPKINEITFEKNT